MNQRIALLLPCFAAILCHGLISADEPAKLGWKYSVDLLRPFWQETVIHGESVLFNQRRSHRRRPRVCDDPNSRSVNELRWWKNEGRQ